MMTTIVMKKPLFVRSDLVTPGDNRMLPQSPGLVKRPHIDVLLTDAFSVVHRGLDDFRRRIEAGEELTLNDWKAFEVMSRQMVSLAGEERAQAAADSLDKLDDAALMELAKKAEKALAG